MYSKRTIRPKAKRTMKKVSKKGAYKSSVKQQTMRRRAPIVETKQRVSSDIAFINGYPHTGDELGSPVNPLNWRLLIADDAFTNIPLRSFQRMSQGFEEYQCIGQSIYSKYLNFKFQLRFPQGQQVTLEDATSPGVTYQVPNRVIQKPTKVYLICGWVTAPLNYPLDDDTSPSLPKQSDAGPEALNAFITQQLKPYFDDGSDKLQFRPKSTTNIKITMYRLLKPNLNGSISSTIVPQHALYIDPNMPGAPVYQQEPHGALPDVTASHNFKTMRKVQLTKGADTTFPVDNQNMFPNNSWIPFAVVYNPDFESQKANWVLTDPQNPESQLKSIQAMEYRSNDAHYFTDS